jgi:hypothetical protein
MSSPLPRGCSVLSPHSRYTEGDARTGIHAEACGRHGGRGCGMTCRCWCHGITLHADGKTLRPDAEATISITKAQR